jgi:phage shock protein A
MGAAEGEGMRLEQRPVAGAAFAAGRELLARQAVQRIAVRAGQVQEFSHA